MSCHDESMKETSVAERVISCLAMMLVPHEAWTTNISLLAAHPIMAGYRVLAMWLQQQRDNTNNYSIEVPSHNRLAIHQFHSSTSYHTQRYNNRCDSESVMRLVVPSSYLLLRQLVQGNGCISLTTFQ